MWIFAAQTGGVTALRDRRRLGPEWQVLRGAPDGRNAEGWSAWRWPWAMVVRGRMVAASCVSIEAIRDDLPTPWVGGVGSAGRKAE
jgi:hypothetical protein